jgi:hypothetical protein
MTSSAGPEDGTEDEGDDTAATTENLLDEALQDVVGGNGGAGGNGGWLWGNGGAGGQGGAG